MAPTDATSNEPDGSDEIRYDLAGNPLPPLPRADLPKSNFSAADRPLPGNSGPFSPSVSPPVGIPVSAPPPAVKTSPSPVLFLVLGLGVLLLVGVIWGVHTFKPKPVVAPTAYKTYTALDSSFTCDQPGGWTMHETGATSGNLATVTFEDGHAKIRIISDMTGSVMADTMNASNANLPPDQQVPAVQKLHVKDETQLANDLPGYKEGDPQKFQSSFGEARVSEWTASGSLHGYRVTMLGRDREFTVICICPERNWAILKPAFQRIISSVKAGTSS